MVKLLDQSSIDIKSSLLDASGNQENCKEISFPVRSLRSFQKHFTVCYHRETLLLQRFSRRCPSAQNVLTLVPRPLPPTDLLLLPSPTFGFPAVVWGECNHSFHNCCMSLWVKQNNRCPLCQQDWVVQRIGK